MGPYSAAIFFRRDPVPPRSFSAVLYTVAVLSVMRLRSIARSWQADKGEIDDPAF
jgi:hypothetical protein